MVNLLKKEHDIHILDRAPSKIHDVDFIECDLLESEEVEQIREWASDLDKLAMAMPNLDGMSGVMSSQLLRVLQVLALESNLLAVSSKEGEGMDDLYSIIQSTFSGGDDLEAHSDNN